MRVFDEHGRLIAEESDQDDERDEQPVRGIGSLVIAEPIPQRLLGQLTPDRADAAAAAIADVAKLAGIAIAGVYIVGQIFRGR
jgi:hypothetical protein